ncbi:MAG: glycosyltransferase family 39 protein [Phototrophicaceae bacterium]
MSQHSTHSIMKFFTLILILLLAFAIRVFGSDALSLWLDEGASYYVIDQPNLLNALTTTDVHPPLYFYLLKGWAGLTGISEFSLRYFSLLMGMLVVALSIPLGRLLHIERWGAILAALWLALSLIEIGMAQEVRMYTLRSVWVCLSMLGYLEWMRHPQHTTAWVIWLSSSVLLVYTHYTGLLLPLIQGCHILLFMRSRQRWYALGTLAIVGVCFAPCFGLITLRQFQNDQGIYAAIPSTWESLWQLGREFLGGQWALIGGLALLGVGARRPLRHTVLLGLWVVLTVALTFMANLYVDALSVRRIMLINPALALWIGQGMVRFKSWRSGFLVGVIALYTLATYQLQGDKLPWDAVATSITDYAQAEQVALMEVYRGDYALGYYLDRWMPPDTETHSLWWWRGVYGASYREGFAELIADFRVVWLAYWWQDPTIFEVLCEEGYLQTADMTTYHREHPIHVYRFERLDAFPTPSIDFQNGMRLLKSEVHADQVELWWQTETPLTQDYSVSVFVLDGNGQLVQQHDSYPLENQAPTTTWQVGQVVYDAHPLPTHDGATIGVKVYTWQDGHVIPTQLGQEWVELRR